MVHASAAYLDTKTCRNCRTANSESNLVCVNCGFSLGVPCNACGTENLNSANFCQACGIRFEHGANRGELRGRAADRPQRETRSLPPEEGERKFVTIMFADIANSTALVDGLDPEQARQILEPSLNAMIDAVHKYEGIVNRVDGDGFIALFGAPNAHEDHAIRACMAAEEIHQAIREHPQDGVKVRIGLNSGEVLVLPVENDLSVNYQAEGPTVHLASRMEKRATPGTTLITQSTFRLAREFVRAKPQGKTRVKGLSSPIDTYQLLGKNENISRWQARASAGLSAFVGREAELERLHSIIGGPGGEAGRVVAIEGDPGIGKSRLVSEFSNTLVERGWKMLETGSSSYHRRMPYYAFTRLLESYFNLERTPVDERRHEIGCKFDELEMPLRDVRENISMLLGIDAGNQIRNKQDITKSIFSFLIALANKYRNLLLVFEDIHWFDSESSELLNNINKHLRMNDVLVVYTYRVDEEIFAQIPPDANILRISPLSEDAGLKLAGQLIDTDARGGATASAIAKMADGNPFVIEEMVRSHLESSGNQHVHTIPPGIHAVVSSRVDRLPAEMKKLLQVASVVGNNVEMEMILDLVDGDYDQCWEYIDRLSRKSFLKVAGGHPHKFGFRHTITREVIYNSLPTARKKAIHSAVLQLAERLNEKGRPRIDVELLARHANLGERWEKSALYSREAGTKASQCFAYSEAMYHFAKALAALEQLDDSRENQIAIIAVCAELRNAAFPLGARPEIKKYLEKGLEIAGKLGDADSVVRFEAYLTHFFWLTGHWKQAIETGERAASAAERLGNRSIGIATREYLGMASYSVGRLDDAVSLFSANIQELGKDGDQARFGLLGLPSVLSRSWLSWSLCEKGEFAQARKFATEAVLIAEEAGHPFDQVLASLGMSGIHLWQGDVDLAEATLSDCENICKKSELHLLLPRTLAALGYTLVYAGRASQGDDLLATALGKLEAMNVQAMRSQILVWASEAAFSVGDAERSDQLLAQALKRCRSHGERAVHAWGSRLAGLIAERSMQTGEARKQFERAARLAKKLGMLPLLADATARLAQFEKGSKAASLLEQARQADFAIGPTLWSRHTRTAVR